MLKKIVILLISSSILLTRKSLLSWVFFRVFGTTFHFSRTYESVCIDFSPLKKHKRSDVVMSTPCWATRECYVFFTLSQKRQKLLSLELAGWLSLWKRLLDVFWREPIRRHSVVIFPHQSLSPVIGMVSGWYGCVQSNTFWFWKPQVTVALMMSDTLQIHYGELRYLSCVNQVRNFGEDIGPPFGD